MRYDILLFDLDGTLLNFEASENAALKRLLKVKGYGENILETYSGVNKGLWRLYENGIITMAELLNTRFKKTMEIHGVGIDGQEWEKEYRQYLGEYAFIIDGADSVLERLSQSHRLFAITNGVGDTQMSRLKLAGLLQYFEKIFISQLIGAQKPSKEFFDHVMKNIEDFDIKKALVIGDSITADISGGNNAGIDTCLVNLKNINYENAYNCTYEINSLEELCKIC
ncbi:putative HAD-hydrolase YfnB [Clostridiales bacterium]|nr:putative HAD-hydrolase YfnB [Clostridiales bacterium]